MKVYSPSRIMKTPIIRSRTRAENDYIVRFQLADIMMSEITKKIAKKPRRKSMYLYSPI